MADNWLQDSTRRAKAPLIDTSVPSAARVADYLVGGRDNFEADRQAVRSLSAAAPVIGTSFAAARAFHQRAVRYLVAGRDQAVPRHRYQHDPDGQYP